MKSGAGGGRGGKLRWQQCKKKEINVAYFAAHLEADKANAKCRTPKTHTHTHTLLKHVVYYSSPHTHTHLPYNC